MFGQFCGGEDIEECQETIHLLGKYNVGTILDFATEACESDADFERVLAEVMHTIELAQVDVNVPFAVFKPTGLGRSGLLEKKDRKLPLSSEEQEEFELIRNRFERICQYAYDHKVRILVDAEESWIQDSVDQLVRDMMMKFNKERAIVYNTIQLYRNDRLDFLKRSYGDAAANAYSPVRRHLMGILVKPELIEFMD